MKKRLQDKSGMTLIEVIVAMLIFAVFSVSVSAVMAPILNIYYRTNQLSELNALADDIVEQVSNDISISSSKPIVVDPQTLDCFVDGNKVSYQFKTIDAVENLYVSFNNQPDALPVHDIKYFKNNRKMTIEFSENPIDDIYSMKLVIFDKDSSKLIERSIQVKQIIQTG